MNLDDNRILYADMLNSLHFDADVLYEIDTAILLCDRVSKIYYCAAKNHASADEMMAYLPNNFEILVSHDTYCNEAITSKTGMHYESQCVHCVYLDKERLDFNVPDGYILKQLTRDYMQDVITMYKKEMHELANEQYIGMNIDAGMFGIFEHHILCGFIGVHEGGYGSIGMLEVKEAYRRKGFATILEKVMINEQIKRGHIPYGEIFIENESSIALQDKVGMRVGKDLTFWFYQ